MPNLSVLGESDYIYVKGMIEKDLYYFLTHILLKAPEMEYAQHKDNQVPNCKSVIHREIVFDTLLERMWPYIENAVGEELLPTYSYARLYSNGDEMKNHTDRDACEVSVTIQLGRSHNYSYPIYMNDNRIDMNEGDGVIYFGSRVPHYRKVCDGPEGYYSGQVFLHYVRKNGPHAGLVGDLETRKAFKIADKVVLVKNRTLLMEEK